MSDRYTKRRVVDISNSKQHWCLLSLPGPDPKEAGAQMSGCGFEGNPLHYLRTGPKTLLSLQNVK